MIGRQCQILRVYFYYLVRRPYGIGDRIHVSNVETDTNFTGSAGWVSHVLVLLQWQDRCILTFTLRCCIAQVVENITLFETTAIWGPTKMQFVERLHGQQSHHQRCALRKPSSLFLRIPIDIEDSYFSRLQSRVFEKRVPRNGSL
jgi:hypothetical protein